jgi:hypothetical protein
MDRPVGLEAAVAEAVLFRDQSRDRRLDRPVDKSGGGIIANDAVIVGEDVDPADPGVAECGVGPA